MPKLLFFTPTKRISVTQHTKPLWNLLAKASNHGHMEHTLCHERYQIVLMCCR